MKLSRLTFKFDVGESSGILLYNSASGAMDMIGRDALAALEGKSEKELSEATTAYLLQRGHLARSAAEDEEVVAAEYEKFKQREQTVSLRFVVIPTYRCNSRCAYCFLSNELENGGLMEDDVMDSAFAAIDRISAERGARSLKQLSVFGGEPLIDEPPQRRTIDRLLGMAADRGLEIDFVTNGNDLAGYVPLLAKHGVHKVQVTFDGLEDYHNHRRRAVDRKGSSFGRIVAGIDAALTAGVNVNARIHLTKENVDTLPQVADFFQAKGWIGNPGFTSHIGTVFDCFRCMPEKETRRHLGPDEGNRRLMQALDGRADVADMLELDWQGVRRLVTTGQFFPTTFRTCYGGSRTFAFDLYGGIYVCETTAGKPEYRVGDFHLEFAFNAHVNYGSIADAGCRKMSDALEYGLQFYWPRIDGEEEAPANTGCACSGRQ